MNLFVSHKEYDTLLVVNSADKPELLLVILLFNNNITSTVYTIIIYIYIYINYITSNNSGILQFYPLARGRDGILPGNSVGVWVAFWLLSSTGGGRGRIKNATFINGFGYSTYIIPVVKLIALFLQASLQFLV